MSFTERYWTKPGGTKNRNAVELEPVAEGNPLYGMLPWSLFLTGVSVLVAIEGAFVWNFFISPNNYLLRITLMLLTIVSVVYSFLRRFQ